MSCNQIGTLLKCYTIGRELTLIDLLVKFCVYSLHSLKHINKMREYTSIRQTVIDSNLKMNKTSAGFFCLVLVPQFVFPWQMEISANEYSKNIWRFTLIENTACWYDSNFTITTICYKFCCWFLFFFPCFYCAYGTSFQTTTSSVITFCHLSAHLKPATVGYGITSLARSVWAVTCNIDIPGSSPVGDNVIC